MRTIAVALTLSLAAGVSAQPSANGSRSGNGNGNGAHASDSAARAIIVPAMGTWTFAPFIGGGLNSPVGYNWGITPDRDQLYVGIHMSTPVLKVWRLTLLYAPNIVPLVVVSNNPRYEWVTTGGVARKVETSRGPVFGTGMVPFGLQVETPFGENAALFSQAGIGGALFSDVMPMDGAKRFNFSIEFGGGVTMRTRSRYALQVGYKFHHFSNMYTARENPGVDGHLFYLGWRWTKRLPRE